jgi:hypothetical protein
VCSCFGYEERTAPAMSDGWGNGIHGHLQSTS